MLKGTAASGAIFSEDEVYRYLLWRRWGPGPSITWLMLNPSTADEEKLDPTVRRCKSFSEMWGFGRLVVCNLFAYRATEPRDLFQSPAPVGPLNNEYLVYGHWASVLTVAAWGAYGGRGQRSHYVTAILTPLRTLACLGKTAGGEPKHPLYLSHKTRLEPHA